MVPSVRVLAAGDEAAFLAFLEPRAASSMFLLSNSRAAGLVDEGQRFQATYVGAFADGQLVAVAAHCWNGVLLVQAPAELVAEETLLDVATTAVATSAREVTGFSGPADQIAIARGAIVLPRPPALDALERLYALSLGDLHVPPALAHGDVVCRTPAAGELPLLGEWRHAYALETMSTLDTPENREHARRTIVDSAAVGSVWVVDASGTPVAMTAFNARLPDIVQVGGVYTPPALRGRGYARAAVAGSLLDARARGVRRAILFTKDPSAARAYEAIGFQRIGDYALVLL
jgi:GNAT superfamily N-acetyltransferase